MHHTIFEICVICYSSQVSALQKVACLDILQNWINESNVKILNMAGQRASKTSEIYDSVKKITLSVLNRRNKYNES